MLELIKIQDPADGHEQRIRNLCLLMHGVKGKNRNYENTGPTNHRKGPQGTGRDHKAPRIMMEETYTRHRIMTNHKTTLWGCSKG